MHTPSDSLAIAGMVFSAAMDWRTLGVPYSVARQLDIDDMYKADRSRKPSADTFSAIM